MTRNSKDFTYDNATLLKDAGLIAASAAATVATVARILNMGAARFDGRVIVDASAIEADTGDELYTILVQGSNSATFASGIVTLAALVLGDATTTLESVDTPIGRREIAVCNEINGTVYQYVRVYTKVVGTIATGINYTAFLVTDA